MQRPPHSQAQSQAQLFSRMNLSAGQEITTVASGANVYGIYVNTLNVPAYTSVAPPGEENILNYLAEVSKDPPPVIDTNLKQKELWKVQVEARANDYGSETKDLWTAIRERFAQQNPERFIQRVLVLGEAGMGRTPALLQVQQKVALQSIAYLKRSIKRGEIPADGRLSERCLLPFYISLAHIRAGYDLPTLIRDQYNAKINAFLQNKKRLGEKGETISEANPSEPSGGDSKQKDRTPTEDATPNVNHGDSPQLDINTISIEQVPALLNRYTCLFLFDDLEFLFAGNQQSALAALVHFMEYYPHQYVIACRTSSNWRQLGPIARIYLADFPEEKARHLLGQERYQRLRFMAPSLVRNRASLHKILGDKEKDLLNQSAGLLVQTDIQSRLEDRVNDVFAKYELPLHLVKRLLERLALTMYLQGVSTLTEHQVMEVSIAYLHEWHANHDWWAILNAFEKAEFLQCDPQLRLWSFCHQRAQAYFAAAALVADPAQRQAVVGEAADYRWRPVLELLTGLLPDPSSFVFELIDRDALVAALCVDAAGKAANPRTISAVIDALLERMKLESSLRRQPIVERIGQSTHPRVLETLLRALQQEWSSKVVMSILFAICTWSANHPEVSVAETETELLRASAREQRSVADVLIHCQTCWDYQSGKKRKAAIDELIKIVQEATHPQLVRGLAAIGLGIAKTATARRVLLERFQMKETNDFVAWCGTEALSLLRHHRDVESAAIALCEEQEYQKEEWARHRARAIYLLGHMRKDNTTAQRLAQALHDQSPFVRSCAVEALAQMDLRTGLARRQIEQLLDPQPDTKAEADPMVLRNIAEALGRIGNVSTVAKLKPYLHHEVARTRWAVQQAIVEIQTPSAVPSATIG